MTYSTGNEARDKRLHRAIGEVVACNEPLTLEQVATHLPEDFAADAEEFSGMLSNMAQEEPEPYVGTIGATPMIDKTPTGEPLGKTQAMVQEFVEHIEAAEAMPAQITEFEARAMLTAANSRLEKAREAMWIAQRDLKFQKENRATQINLWQLMFKPYQQTREQLVRETIEQNQRHKQAIADGAIPPTPQTPRARSYIDRMSGRGGTASDFARRYEGVHTNNNGEPVKVHKGYRRNAIPSQFQGRTVKLPSQQ